MIKVIDMNKTIFFMTILLLAGVVSADGGNAFPQDEAGISAYVNIGGSINLEDATTAYTQILNISETHAIGTIKIFNVHATDKIHVYVDVNGWIVAYLERDEQLGQLVQWSGISVSNPEVKITLEEAIEKVCEEIDVNYTNIEDNIAYYDFEYPDANKMSIFLNARNSDGDDYAHMYLPNAHTLYEAGYSLVNTIRLYWEKNYGLSKLYVDNILMASTKKYDERLVSEYDIASILNVGETHTMWLHREDHHISGWSGMASVLIYY